MNKSVYCPENNLKPTKAKQVYNKKTGMAGWECSLCKKTGHELCYKP